VKLRNVFNYRILYLCLICVLVLVSCARGRSVTEGTEGDYPPGGSALEQRVARLEGALKRRDEQLSTLRQELRQATEERDEYETKLEQANEELVNLKEQNEARSCGW